MPIKPIAAGTPQRIISKINEIIGAVNTGGSGGSGTADAILDAATIADAGKALGIDAEGEPSLITVEGGGASLLVCNLTYTGTGDPGDPYVGHLDHAAEILDALNSETEYSPLIVIIYTRTGEEPGQLIPAMAIHMTGEYQGSVFTEDILKAYGDVQGTGVKEAFNISISAMGSTVYKQIDEQITGITANDFTVVDDVITYSENAI